MRQGADIIDHYNTSLRTTTHIHDAAASCDYPPLQCVCVRPPRRLPLATRRVARSSSSPLLLEPPPPRAPCPTSVGTRLLVAYFQTAVTLGWLTVNLPDICGTLTCAGGAQGNTYLQHTETEVHTVDVPVSQSDRQSIKYKNTRNGELTIGGTQGLRHALHRTCSCQHCRHASTNMSVRTA